MYDCNMLLLWTLLALLAIQVSTELIVIGPLVARMKSMCQPYPVSCAPSDRYAAVIRLPPGFDFPGCLPENVSASQWTYWIPSALFELTLVLLAARKLIQVARTRNRAPRILAVLLRDSVIYFGGIFATILCTLVTWTSARVSSVFAGVCAQLNPERLTGTIGHALHCCDGVRHRVLSAYIYIVLSDAQTRNSVLSDIGLQDAGTRRGEPCLIERWLTPSRHS